MPRQRTRDVPAQVDLDVVEAARAQLFRQLLVERRLGDIERVDPLEPAARRYFVQANSGVIASMPCRSTLWNRL